MEEETRTEEVQDVQPNEQIANFGTSVQDKVALVESGELSAEEFIDECIAELEAIKTEMNETVAGPLGGLGGGILDLPEPEEV